ncbi:Gfo/Idh/MocA family oxidoreductase, partial [bacterium]|nr:Gfo/Idh/MocA family oxidoreductase [bacterium]
MTSRMNRRDFLRSVTYAGTSLFVLRDSRSASSYRANEKLNIAIVGVGGRGTYHARTILSGSHNLVAICDANRNRPGELSKIPPEVSRYQDFRKMLDDMDRRIDAVIVATTDHNHAVVSAAAMKRGKHVFCEKPLAHDVAEARAMRQIAKQKKVATQMGNQGMASDSFRRTLELIQEGAVGEVREVHLWFVFGGSGPRKVPKGSVPVPEYLDWDLWLGPARFRPYHPLWVNSAHGWRDFGTGALGGGGSHSVNLAFK